jgi:uncharacterized protein (TIGR00251 family)
MFQDEPSAAGKPAATRILLKVVPGSRRDQIVGALGDRLKIKVSAPPEDGRANEAVCALLAEALGVSASDVEIVAGHTRPEKTVRVAGVSPGQVQGKLGL